jgi:hypothetical protein
MPRTVLAISHTRGTAHELGHATLAIASRPEVFGLAVPVQDVNGHALDTVVLTEDSDHDGETGFVITIAGPDDPISSASEGDVLA